MLEHMFTTTDPPQAPSSLADAIARLDAALTDLAAAELGTIDDRELLDGITVCEQQLNRLNAVQLRLLGAAAPP